MLLYYLNILPKETDKSMKTIHPLSICWIMSGFLFLFFSVTIYADSSSTIEIDDDIQIDILNIHPATSDHKLVTIIWFACNQGDETVEFNTARKLTAKGYQFYFPDMLSAHFLSPTPSSIARVPTQEVVTVIRHILNETKSEEVYIIAAARAAVPVLKSLSDKKILLSSQKLKGALLISPRINRQTPQPGEEPVYIHEAGLSTHPILILEGERTPNRWGLPHLIQRLAKSGSLVRSDLLKGVRGFFYLRSEQTQPEAEMTARLDHIIHSNIQKLGAIKP